LNSSTGDERPELIRVEIKSDADTVVARQRGRDAALRIGLTRTEATFVATAISEIARNMLDYAHGGQIELEAVVERSRKGIVVTARDRGPGIPDIERAMQDGYSTGKGLGLGLPGARRLMDEFSIESSPTSGTVIVLKKWQR
jgi:serine/threonine-protein kinase RsbT